MIPRRAPSPQPRRRRARAVAPPTPGSAADARRADRSMVLVAVVVLLGSIGLLLWAIADVVLLVFAGALFALFLRGLVEPVARGARVTDTTALILVLGALGGLVVLGGVFLGGETATQLDELGPRLHEAWTQMQRGMREYQIGRALLAERDLTALVPQNAEWVERIGGLFSTTLGAIAGFFIVMFIGLYGAVSPQTYRDGLLYLVPRDSRERAAEVMDEVVDTLRNWLLGTFIKMVVVGTAVTIGLWLLDIPLALALGLIAFALEFAPYVGPVLAALPAVLVALALGPQQALSVVLLYLGVQAAENYVLSPLVDLRSVKLPPALTIAAQVLLGALLGALGVMFATPLTATGVVLVRMLYVEPDEPAPEAAAAAEDAK
ncbi:AI-2E family transporter [Azoarcus olearius]|uniref:Conserved hypothetical membrane protein n=1 Tax=Azoarcus sp. (strain BH72) TaxID=418699 RepID=A1K6C4_AZOSB|nr:AI-2E family transporter [Azoarcus olearius]CAL94379.1 conserved hypothetical membrane protein [Azoarcus olearius]